MDTPDAPTLRERRADRTRGEIESAAIALFVAQGYEATSMEQVADAAGVSRRTLYRYFDTKHDIVFEAPRRWLEVFDRAVATRAAGEDLPALFRRGLLDVARYVEETADTVLPAFSILGSSPDLAARHGRSDAEWVTHYLGLLGPELAAGSTPSPQAAFAATVLAMAIVAGQNAVMIHWAAAHPAARAEDLMGAMLDQLDGAWPPALRSP